jgi:peptide/nickel transport system permease protein
MMQFILGRVVQSAATILGVTIVAFALVRASGSPVELLVPHDASPEERARITRSLGLDQPFLVQYGRFLQHGITGDFGRSIRYNRPVSEVVFERLGNTARLGMVALALAVCVGVPVGVYAALAPGSMLDRVARLFALVGQSIPNFWLAVMLILVFAVKLRLLPTSGMASWKSYIMPAVTLSLLAMASLMRLTRSAMIDFMASDVVAYLRAKGLPDWRIEWLHGLRNASIPLVGAFAIQFVGFLGGSVIIEQIFAWPGVGRLAVESIFQRDYPVVQMLVVVMGTLFIVANLFADVMYGVLDPRIRR